MWTPAFLVFVTSLTVDLTQAQVCGNVPIVWRNSNHTCPPRAICADIFDTIRDWYNGTTCPEKRTLHNCFCQSGVCPVNNPDHEMYASSYHRIYTCEPKCQLPYCSNIRTFSTSNGPIAMTTEQQSPEFHGLTFNKIDCRCPRHHSPSIGNGIMHHSVKSSGTTYNIRNHNYQTRLTCRNAGSDSQREDPCST